MEEHKVQCPYCGNSRFFFDDEQNDETSPIYHRAVCIICGASSPWTVTRADALHKIKEHQESYFEALDAFRTLRSIREELREIVNVRLDAFD